MNPLKRKKTEMFFVCYGRSIGTFFWLLLTVAATIVSCSKSSEDQLGRDGPRDPDEPGGINCDTTNRRYAAHVVPILVSNCYGCHGANTNGSSGGIILEGYTNLNERATNGDLIAVITHSSGVPAMPKDAPKLSDCHINIIRSWIENGAQDN